MKHTPLIQFGGGGRNCSWLAKASAVSGIAIGLCIFPMPQTPVSAALNTQEKEVLEGKVHEFGDAFFISLGGKLYDDFWAGSGASPLTRRNPAFPSDKVVSDADSWRCVSCHGWDYKGADKAPDSEQQPRQFVSLRHLQGADNLNVTEVFTKAHPDHPIQTSRGLLLDLLVLFVSAGQYETETFQPNATVPPDHLSRGRDIFEGACMSCHDTDGKSGFTTRPGLRRSLGWLARNKPRRAVHKIINGVPGQIMLSLRFVGEEAIADLLIFLKTLDPEANPISAPPAE